MDQFIKRLQSLGWRVTMMALAFILEITASNLGVLELSPELTIFLGLLLGEASKALNNYLKGYL